MKKFAVMMCLTVAALMLAAAEINVNGTFQTSKAGASLPDGWIVNTGPKPVGKHEMIRKGDSNWVRVNGEKSMYGIATRTAIPVKPGEKYRLSVVANGQDVVANVGFFMYNGTVGSHKYLQGNYQNPVKLKGLQTITRDIEIPATVKGTEPNLIKVTFYVMSPGQAEFSNFKLEKLD